MARSRGSDGCLKVSIRNPSLIGGLALAFVLFYALVDSYCFPSRVFFAVGVPGGQGGQG